MAIRKSPQEIAAKWASRLSASTNEIKAGVMAVTEAPTAKAARSLDLLLQKLTEAITSGRMAAALNAVSLPDWQKAMIDKGINRIASGAIAAEPKFVAFMTQFIPHLDQVQAKLATMPRGDIEANLNRMMVNARMNHEFKMQRGGL